MKIWSGRAVDDGNVEGMGVLVDIGWRDGQVKDELVENVTSC